MKGWAWAAAAACVSMGLTACSPTLRAGWQTMEQAWRGPAPVRQADLNPELRYLLVQEQNREALLVWVGDEPGLLGTIQVWVGADGVVLRTAHGRLVGVTEATRQWRLISHTSPDARTVSEVVDTQPDHRFGLHHTWQRTPLSAAPPQHRFFGSLDGLSWEEDREAQGALPPSLWALNAQGQAVYGQRCLTPAWCVSWQAWPPHPPASP